MSRLDEISSVFRAVDDELRLQVLLDWAKRMPAPPAELAAQIGVDDAARVHECTTPVWMWVVPSGNDEIGADGTGVGHAQRVRFHAHVAEEAPTVLGVLSVVAHAYADAPAGVLAALPLDLIERLGLGKLLRMNRILGLNAMVHRIRREAAALASSTAPTKTERAT